HAPACAGLRGGARPAAGPKPAPDDLRQRFAVTPIAIVAERSRDARLDRRQRGRGRLDARGPRAQAYPYLAVRGYRAHRNLALPAEPVGETILDVAETHADRAQRARDDAARVDAGSCKVDQLPAQRRRWRAARQHREGAVRRVARPRRRARVAGPRRRTTPPQRPP